MRLHAIVPCRDAEAYVKRCVDSFLAYPGPELEVVTPGDASADGTGALLDALAERQPCLHLVRFGAAGGWWAGQRAKHCARASHRS
jgi:hypothetical protein